jgi:hypothetical protein
MCRTEKEIEVQTEGVEIVLVYLVYIKIFT